jgi:hypothetical protein
VIAGSHVVFTNQADKHIDLPDPAILELHAAFSRVLYASAAAEYFEAMWRDEDATRVLSVDGASDLGALFSSAFGPRAIFV